jgi:hypothetical protein
MTDRSLKALFKIDRRQQWKTLKTKYKAEISRAKIDLDLKLGPGLDKYQVEVNKVAKLAASRNLTNGDILPITRVTSPLFGIVDRYQTRVKALTGPAGKELGAMLTALQAEFTGWDDLAKSLPSVAPKTSTPAQTQAVKPVVTTLMSVRGMVQNVENRAPRAAAFFKQAGAPAAAKLAVDLLSKARAAGPDVLNLRAIGIKAEVVDGTNYALFKTRAQTVVTLLEDFSQAAQAYIDGFPKTVSTGPVKDTDALALKSTAVNVIHHCQVTREKIAELPNAA